MGTMIQAYRQAIGIYDSKKKLFTPRGVKTVKREEKSSKLFTSLPLLLISLLLIRGCVEVNPGPTHITVTLSDGTIECDEETILSHPPYLAGILITLPCSTCTELIFPDCTTAKFRLLFSSEQV